MTTRGETLGIAGAGRFGTALGIVVARSGRRVVVWSRAPRSLSLSNEVPASLEVTDDPRRLAREARLIILAVRSTHVAERSRALGDVIDGGHIVIHSIGALVSIGGSGPRRVSEVVAEGVPTHKLGALAGPALPEDLAQGQFSSMVVASAFDEVVAEARRLLNLPPSLRIYGSSDLAGVELASALSGAYTVAVGLADGLGIGVGPRAVLITRAIAEASRLGAGIGAEPRTFAGLSGLGNLLVRTTGDRSTDYVLGRRLATAPVAADQHTEGARAAIAGRDLAHQLGVRTPVLDALAGVLAGTLEPPVALQRVGDTVADEE